jgi:hypothetical protein
LKPVRKALFTGAPVLGLINRPQTWAGCSAQGAMRTLPSPPWVIQSPMIPAWAWAAPAAKAASTSAQADSFVFMVVSP